MNQHHHHNKSSDSISSPSVHLKRKLTTTSHQQRTPKHPSPNKPPTQPDHGERDAFNGLVREYNRQLVSS